MRYMPSLFVVASRVAPVPTFATLTEAPEIADPFRSVTAPEIEPLIVCALPIAGNKRTNANIAEALDNRVFRNIFINYLLDRFSGLCVRTAIFAVGGSGAEAAENIIRRISNSIS